MTWPRWAQRVRYSFARARSRIPLRIERLRPALPYPRDRFAYQQQHVQFDIAPGSHVLDIGSGSRPFPHATHLVDRYLEPTEHRPDGLNRAGLPLVVSDVEHLPFEDGAFDYVYCCHVLEHVSDPIRACRELMRVAPRGYIETPTLAKDSLFCWGKTAHKWHVVAIAHTLCFFERTARQCEGVRSPVWHELIFNRFHHPLQDVFAANQDLFNVLFPWRGRFSVYVFRLDGSVRSFDAECEARGACDNSSERTREALAIGR